MTWEELTPEAADILRSLSAGPRPLPDDPMLQLLLADHLVKGSSEKMQITQQGRRLLGQYVATEIGNHR
jgi:hypothetical protein